MVAVVRMGWKKRHWVEGSGVLGGRVMEADDCSLWKGQKHCGEQMFCCRREERLR